MTSIFARGSRRSCERRVWRTGSCSPDRSTKEDRADAFAASAAWALSSYTENFGVAVMEALAVGLPTIVSTEVNIADAIRRSRAGVVAGLDPAEFGGALLNLLRDHALRAGLAERGRAFAAGYDWSAVAPQLEAMYRRARVDGPLSPCVARPARDTIR